MTCYTQTPSEALLAPGSGWPIAPTKSIKVRFCSRRKRRLWGSVFRSQKSLFWALSVRSKSFTLEKEC